jgi:AraC family transcriptional regulator, L-rhamnose operon transcriptional activator RhaR
MLHPNKIQHLTRNKIFLNPHAPYAIYRHQVVGDHINNVHDHDFVEIVLITGGTGTQSTPYGDVQLLTGAFFVIQPDVWHGYFDCDAMLVNVCAIDIRLFDCELAWMRENAVLHALLWENAITPERERIPIYYFGSSQIVRCSKAIFMLQEIESKQTLQARAHQIGRLTTFLAEAADCVSNNVPLPRQNDKTTGLSDVVEKTLQLFSENLAHDWSITELSAQFGLTTPYYIRLFKREMGESPHSYLSGLRARRAAQYLIHSESTVTQVGEEVGWSDLGYFSRRFRHHFGISPREYRQKYRDLMYT